MSTTQTKKPYYSEKVQNAYEKRKLEEASLVENYKSDINLVTYLAANGWEPVKGKHTQNWAAMEEVATGRKLMIHRVLESGHYAYKSFQDNQDKGTILNLVAQDKKLDLGTREGWKQLHAYLSPMVGNVYNTHESIRPTGYKDLARLSEAATVQLLNIQPLQDRTWLHSRHISDEVIDSPEFKGQIVQRPFETKSGYTGINTAFPLRNMDHIVTLNTRGVTDKGKSHNMLVSAKHDAVWMSNVVPGVKPKDILIAENPLDALSHRQLYPPAIPGERIYLSTAGQPGGLQIPTIQSIINQLQFNKVILGNDNDFSGVRFNIQHMGELHLPQQGNSPWKAYLTAGNQKTNETNQLRLTLGQGREVPAGQSPSDLVARLDKLMNAGHQVEETKATIKLGKTHAGDIEIVASIPNTRPMLIRAENFVKEVRGTGEFMVVKRSVEKDFNDDLKVVVNERLAQEDKIRQSRPENRRHEPITPQPEWLINLQKKLEADKLIREASTQKVAVGPTGLVLHNYAKGDLKNELPDDGAKRIRKETPAIEPVSKPTVGAQQVSTTPALREKEPDSGAKKQTNTPVPSAGTTHPAPSIEPKTTDPKRLSTPSQPAIQPKTSPEKNPPMAPLSASQTVARPPAKAKVAEGAPKPGASPAKTTTKNETKNETKIQSEVPKEDLTKKAGVSQNATRHKR